MDYLWIFLLAGCIIGVFWLYGLATAEYLDKNGNQTTSPGLEAVDFPETNVEVAKDQDQYRTLPALVEPCDEQHPYGHMVTCWRMSRLDRLKFILTGRLWVSVMTFHEPVQPLYFTVNKSDVIVQKQLGVYTYSFVKNLWKFRRRTSKI